jgi:hypothetical protein
MIQPSLTALFHKKQSYMHTSLGAWWIVLTFIDLIACRISKAGIGIVFGIFEKMR